MITRFDNFVAGLGICVLLILAGIMSISYVDFRKDVAEKQERQEKQVLLEKEKIALKEVVDKAHPPIDVKIGETIYSNDIVSYNLKGMSTSIILIEAVYANGEKNEYVYPNSIEKFFFMKDTNVSAKVSSYSTQAGSVAFNIDDSKVKQP